MRIRVGKPTDFRQCLRQMRQRRATRARRCEARQPAGRCVQVAEMTAPFANTSFAVAFAMRNDGVALRANDEADGRSNSKRGARRRPIVIAVNLQVCRCWWEA